MLDRLSDYPRHARLTDEEAREIANSIQITPRRDAPGRYLGTLIARPHAAGWFVEAHGGDGLSDAESASLHAFTRAATFILLTEGPRPGVWERIDEVSFAAHPIEELIDLDVTELLETSLPNSVR